jgi:ankyrin repeat protein
MESPVKITLQDVRQAIDTLQTLLEQKGNPNTTDSAKFSLIHAAAGSVSKSYERVLLLYEFNAQVNCSDVLGRTPLHEAALLSSGSTVALLLQLGASALACDNNGRNALHMAAISGRVESIERLIESGISVNSCTASNNTPLHLAALYDHTHIADTLLHHGASPYKTNVCAATVIVRVVVVNRSMHCRRVVRHLHSWPEPILCLRSSKQVCVCRLPLQHVPIADGGEAMQNESTCGR